MIKKITLDQLQQGMFVHDLNCGWMEHGFLRSRFLVKGDEVLERIQGLGIREVYIDTDKGLDVASAPTEREVTHALEQDLVQVAEERIPTHTRETSLGEERIHARRIHNEAMNVLDDITEDVKAHRRISLDHLIPIVDQMAASISRNPDALLGFSRVRRMGRYQLEHAVNVCALSVAFARSLGLDAETTRDIGLGAFLHDIGKSKLPSAVLNKPGRLTDEEIAIMRRHVAEGFRLVVGIPGIPKIAVAIVVEHHERIDGSGYPKQRQGEEITRFGQMAAIVDVYDAITSDRVYSKGLEPHEALRKMLEWSSHHFNPELVQQFIRCVGIYPVGTLVRLHSGRLGVVVESGRKGLFHPVVRVVMDANRREYLRVQDVDLSRLGPASEERILNAESPAHWRIDPIEVLQLPC